jgi:hypothetical protein
MKTQKINMDKWTPYSVVRKGALVSDSTILVDTSAVEVTGRLLTKLNAAMLTAGLTEGAWNFDKFVDTAPDLTKLVTQYADTIETTDTKLEYVVCDDGVRARVFITANNEIWGMDTRFFDQFKDYTIRWSCKTSGGSFCVYTDDDDAKFIGVIMPQCLFEVDRYSTLKTVEGGLLEQCNRVVTTFNVWNNALAHGKSTQE